MEIVKSSDHEWIEDYQVAFDYRDGIDGEWGSGFSFEANGEGEIFFEDDRPFQQNPAWFNMNKAIADYCDGKCDMVTRDYSRSIRTPMVIRCTESVKVEIAEFRNGQRMNIIETRFETCNNLIELWDDEVCDNCGQWYNSSGQRLRDDWYRNPSNYDDDISDLDGYEMQYAGDW